MKRIESNIKKIGFNLKRTNGTFLLNNNIIKSKAINIEIFSCFNKELYPVKETGKNKIKNRINIIAQFSKLLKECLIENKEIKENIITGIFNEDKTNNKKNNITKFTLLFLYNYIGC